VEHPPVAAGIDTADAPWHGAGEHEAVVDNGLDIDAGRRCRGDLDDPDLFAGRPSGVVDERRGLAVAEERLVGSK
jgi:hypothetical protein